LLDESKGSSDPLLFLTSKEGERETARLERLAQVVEGSLPEGSELVEAQFSAGPLLTLLVDREDGPVDHEFCSRVVSAVSPALEAEGYDGMLEVSSPGIERPLTRPEHFRRFVDTRQRSASRSTWRGDATSRVS
jgi:ribosome maturation factor RimP